MVLTEPVRPMRNLGAAFIWGGPTTRVKIILEPRGVWTRVRLAWLVLVGVRSFYQNVEQFDFEVREDET